MTHLHKLCLRDREWAEHMVYSMWSDSGRHVSSTYVNRRALQGDADWWLRGFDREQNAVNRGVPVYDVPSVTQLARLRTQPSTFFASSMMA